ncbi:VCBS repeat-containing protein [Lentzea sp. NBC_00516]|uniref:VCBS repeat-containing protein n=1 Tax=Lentzea sp. NBC_00516 TaxID=2903582 RepID=UPI002E81919B|nr:VCBS repeat-containing protein [Lentzea sp. NBC_00516]WUD25302.1 VCBS repeat-containing protein [Lentzea sp. NBC_00516]
MKRILVALSAAVMLLSSTSAMAAPPTPAFGAAIDKYATYVGQTTCDPDAKPGVIGFRDLLKAEYGRADLGMTRACNIGGTSEHKEGRALDYPFNAGNSTQAAQAQEIINWLLATDQHGNAHALARRFGLMYMIWNGRIWRAYESSKGWQSYSGDSPHTDHIHFSFTWAGARKQTTWWTSARSLSAESVNGDRYDDLLAVGPDNTMHLYPGTSAGRFGGSSEVGPGWSAFNRIGVGDTNADGFADILATDADGSLHYWHNSGHGTFTKLANGGSGWQTLEWFAVLDVNGDNRADIVGRDGGRLYWYPGEGSGKFSARIFIGEGWASFPRFAGGDADGDGDGDLWATNAAGDLFFWEGNGNGTFSSGREVGAGWAGFTEFNVLDVNGDAKADVVAVRSSDSTLWRWGGEGDGTLSTAVQVGTGWSGFRPASY